MLKYVNTMITFSNPYPASKELKYKNYVELATDELRF